MFSIPVSLFQLLFPLDLFGLCVCFFPSEGHRMLSREFVFCLFIILLMWLNVIYAKLNCKPMWSSVSSSSVCDLWSDCRGLCFSCDLRYVSCWHFELIFADLLLKRIFLDSGSQPFPPFLGGLCRSMMYQIIIFSLLFLTSLIFFYVNFNTIMIIYLYMHVMRL